MNIALIVPVNPSGQEALNQRLSGLRTRFPNATIDVLTLEEARDLSQYERIACFAEDDRTLDSDPHRCVRVTSVGQVLPAKGVAVSLDDYPDLETHPFNRNGPRGRGDLDFACFHYFPYGYLYRLVGLGPINAFGHRIMADLRALENRNPDHRVIACFGGSTVWSICTTYEQSFPAVLERELNAHAKQAGSNRSYTVLNFGVPGAVVLNSIQQFMLFAAALRPDYVIAHDGVNDLFYSCTSDPWLLENHAITYQQQLELWAAMLHQPDFDKDPNLGGPIGQPTDTSPGLMLKAYVRRKREFMTLCRAFGSRFIWATQPFAWSKSALSPAERSRIYGKNDGPIAYAHEFRVVRAMFDLLRPRLASMGADHAVDFDERFGSLGAENTVMADMVHLNADGDDLLARYYVEVLLDLEHPTATKS